MWKNRNIAWIETLVLTTKAAYVHVKSIAPVYRHSFRGKMYYEYLISVCNPGKQLCFYNQLKYCFLDCKVPYTMHVQCDRPANPTPPEPNPFTAPREVLTLLIFGLSQNANLWACWVWIQNGVHCFTSATSSTQSSNLKFLSISRWRTLVWLASDTFANNRKCLQPSCDNWETRRMVWVWHVRQET